MPQDHSEVLDFSDLPPLAHDHEAQVDYWLERAKRAGAIGQYGKARAAAAIAQVHATMLLGGALLGDEL